jgi:hypothetical protein
VQYAPLEKRHFAEFSTTTTDERSASNSKATRREHWEGFLQRLLTRLLTRLLGERELTAKLSTLLTQFLLGMRAFQHRSRGAGFAALTVVIGLWALGFQRSEAAAVVTHAEEVAPEVGAA